MEKSIIARQPLSRDDVAKAIYQKAREGHIRKVSDSPPIFIGGFWYETRRGVTEGFTTAVMGKDALFLFDTAGRHSQPSYLGLISVGITTNFTTVEGTPLD